MRRREFITLVGGLAATWQFAARAQPTKLHRIGALFVGNADSAAFRAELQQEIRKSGYIEGQNVVFEFRSAEQKLDRLPQLAAELIALKVDVIVAVYTPCALAAQRATRDIPIVVVAGDRKRSGGEPCSPWWKYHRRLTDGCRIAWQMSLNCSAT